MRKRERDISERLSKMICTREEKTNKVMYLILLL